MLYGRCDEDLGIPYQPWVEALAHLVGHAPDDVLEAHVDARGPELARLVPGLARRVTDGQSSSTDAESDRHLLFGAVVDLLARVSALAPVVLVLDDLHWADRPTLQLLRHVVSTDVPLRLLLIGTFRDSDVNGEHPLVEVLAALHREPGTERLTLRGLSDDELLSLLETRSRPGDAPSRASPCGTRCRPRRTATPSSSVSCCGTSSRRGPCIRMSRADGSQVRTCACQTCRSASAR